MAVSVPAIEYAASTSSAELLLLKALGEQLNDDYLVLHSVAWISKPQGAAARDGEADILIVHPKLGILVVEVKGGRIAVDQNKQWISTDRRDVKHSIKDPFDQAKRAKYNVLGKIKENPSWERLGIKRFNIGHAAFFPNIGDGHKLVRPDSPREIIGDNSDIQSLVGWVEGALDFWRQDASKGLNEIGTGGVQLVKSIFARVVTTKPLLSMRIATEEKIRLELTHKQIEILDLLQRQRRVLIAGGAGTGKTIIAREKAIRLSNEGMKTLLVCYNRPLADHIREQCETNLNLDVASFHQLCDKWIRRAQKEIGSNFLQQANRDYPNADKFDQLMPLALSNAVDALGPKYDAIIVDEAQDFGDDYWLPIEMLLNNLDNGLLYIFLDENQDIYKRSASLPIKAEPMVLDRNCRNTGAIHNAAYEHYRGSEVVPSEITGVDVEVIQSNTIQKQSRVISNLITRLIIDEKIKPHNIAILICDGNNKSSYESVLADMPIPKAASFGRLENYSEGIIVVDTVARFKGLERDVVILWEGTTRPIERKTRYVGMSRAKSALYVVRVSDA